MLHLAPLVLALLVAQNPAPSDEDTIPGLPEGESPTPPELVNWDLTRARTTKTLTRERISLQGLWRFAALAERETPVVRAEMGWIEMPGHWTSVRTKVYDSRFRLADRLWRGKPLEEFAWAWVDRDITVVDTIHWLDHRIFLVIGGPWSGAEVYVSQRIDKSKTVVRDPAAPPEDTVYAESVAGVERDGECRFEITESLIYPGTSQISLRLKKDADDNHTAAASSAPPFIGLEFVRPGPRVESIRLRRDDQRGELEATVDLMRPKGFPLLPGPPIHTIPMVLKLRLEDAASGAVVQRLRQDIGTMPDLTRTVSLRIPWTSTDQPPPDQGRLRVRFEPKASGAYAPVTFPPQLLLIPTPAAWLPVWFRPPGIYDEPFPVLFRLMELEPVE